MRAWSLPDQAKKQEAKKSAKELKSAKKQDKKKSAKGPPIKKQRAKGKEPMPPGRAHPCLGRLYRTVSLKYAKAYLTFADGEMKEKRRLLVEVKGEDVKARHCGGYGLGLSPILSTHTSW